MPSCFAIQPLCLALGLSVSLTHSLISPFLSHSHTLACLKVHPQARC